MMMYSVHLIDERCPPLVFPIQTASLSLECAALLNQCCCRHSYRIVAKRSALFIRRILVFTRPIHKRIEAMVTRQKGKLALLPNAVTAVVWRHGTGQNVLRNFFCNLDDTC